MPAGYSRKRCEACYNRWKLDKRIETNRAGLLTQDMANHSQAFGLWLEREIGLGKAAVTINDYLPFFQEVERVWSQVPSYGELLKQFGTAWLRRAELPMRWLEEAGLVVVDASAKLDDSERRRIAHTLASLPSDSTASGILDGYHTMLMERLAAGKTSIKSVRLALKPAQALLASETAESALPPDQDAVNTYVGKRPGQRAALGGFIRYLREHHQADVTMPDARHGRARELLRKRLDRELDALVATELDEPEQERQWLILALRAFHNVPRKKGRKIIAQGVTRTKDGYHLEFENEVYYLPARPGAACN